MKNTILFRFATLAMTIVFFTFSSCENKDVNPETSEKVSQLTYIYKGETLLVKYIDNNGSYTLLDNKIGDRIKAVLDGPTSVTYVGSNDENVIYLFDSDEELKIFLKEKNKNKRKSNATDSEQAAYSSYGNAYEHSDYVGANLAIGGYNYYDDLTTIGWDNSISSFIIIPTGASSEATVVFYEHPYYGGRVLTVTVYTQSAQYSNLSNVKYGGIFGNKYSWNDKISSISYY